MKTPFWIEKAWGDQVENATIDDVRTAINETITMDEEHGAFWIGHYENENVLEVHKDLDVFYISGDNQEKPFKTRLNSWQEVEYLYEQFFEENYEQIESFIEAKNNRSQN